MQPFLAMIVPMGSPVGPVDPGYFPPGVGPGQPGGPSKPVDPGYFPPGIGHGQPVDPGYFPPGAIAKPPGTLPPDWGYFPPSIGSGQPGGPSGPVDPGYFPPNIGSGQPVDPGFFPPGAVAPPANVVPPPKPGLPIQLPAQNPSQGGWVYCYVPGYGWMWVEVANPIAQPK